MNEAYAACLSLTKRDGDKVELHAGVIKSARTLSAGLTAADNADENSTVSAYLWTQLVCDCSLQLVARTRNG